MSATQKLLEAGDYYLSMQSTNAANGGGAYYNVSVNQENTEFFENLFGGYDAEIETEQLSGGTDVVFNWEASQADAERNVTYFISIDGGKETKVTKTTYTFKKLAMANHTVRIYAKDEYGNVSQFFVEEFLVEDNVAPNVSGLSATAGEKTATVKFKGTDNVAVAGYYVDVDGHMDYIAAENYNASTGVAVNGLAFGNHTVTVQAEDTSGNLSAVITKNFTVNLPKGAVAMSGGDADELLSIGSSVGYDTFTTDGYSLRNWSGTQLWTVAAEDNCYVELFCNCPTAAVAVNVYRKLDDEFAIKVTGKSCSANRESTISFAADAGNTYYVEVSSTSSGDCDIIANACQYNKWNNSFEDAVDWADLAGGNTETFGALHKGLDNVDYYSFTVSEDGNYTFGLTWSYAKVTQTLYDKKGKQLASQTLNAYDDDGLGGSMSRYLAAGDYVMKVQLASCDSSNYGISFSNVIA